MSPTSLVVFMLLKGSPKVIQEASSKIGVCLEPVKYINSWLVLCTNSGGKARYWVARGDDDLLYVFKLNKKETIDVIETVG